MFGLPKEIAGTIVAAVIAAAISLLGLIISKENKVSDFRQAWIDSLRAEVAAVITHAHAVHGAYLARFPDNPVLWQNVRDDFVKLNEAWAKIKLRLNPKEASSIAILRALQEHEGLFPSGATPDFSKLPLADHKLLDVTQIVLKEEWRRVKFGEYFYRAVTVFAGSLVIGGSFLLFKSTRPLLSLSAHQNEYRVVERTDIYVDKKGRAVVDDYDHDVVHLVFTHDGHRIYAVCDLSTLDKLDSNASCGLRPLRTYECLLGRGEDAKAPMPLSDLTCTDENGRRVYVYVSKED
jgi:hypothetical protein